jgi:hypothetical protein
VLTPVPRIKSPVVVIGDRALNAAEAVVWPVPPLETTNVPARVTAPDVAVLGVNPVVPASNVVTPPEEAPFEAEVIRPCWSIVKFVFV